MLSVQQQDLLLTPLHPSRVAATDTGMSHLQAWDIRRWLIRVFGHAGFSIDTIDLVMLYENSKGGEEDPAKARWRVAYRATVRLEVDGATYTESAAGTNFGWLPDSKRDEAHDMAIKTATSQAMKRCAVNLGDQFGLSLYEKGHDISNLKPAVKDTIPHRQATDAASLQDAEIGAYSERNAPPAHPDEPVPADEHDPTVEQSEPVDEVELESMTVDPTAYVEALTADLQKASAIEVKAKRISTVTRLGLEVAKQGLGKKMTSHNVTLDTLVDWAFAGQVPQ
jgi:hypothetical protein